MSDKKHKLSVKFPGGEEEIFELSEDDWNTLVALAEKEYGGTHQEAMEMAFNKILLYGIIEADKELGIAGNVKVHLEITTTETLNVTVPKNEDDAKITSLVENAVVKWAKAEGLERGNIEIMKVDKVEEKK